MRVHRSLDQLPKIPAPVVTMGSFDGVHHGHRVIIRRLNDLASAQEGESVLITFHPHPRKVLYPETAGRDLRLISTLEEKCHLLEETGLDHLVVMEFTREFSMTSSDSFVLDYLLGRLRAQTIVVGFNHFFGHNKEGSFDSLYHMSRIHDFRVEEIPEQEIQNETVSSTKIRKALGEGHIQRANAYLEHFFLMRLNLGSQPALQGHAGRSHMVLPDPDQHKLIPPPGGYAVSYPRAGRRARGLLRIGEGGLQLYPEQEDVIPGGGELDLHFHKHLGALGLDREMAKLFELIY